MSVTARILEIYKNAWVKPLNKRTVLPKFDKSTAFEICKRTIELLDQQSAYIELGTPLTVVGDLHGSINDIFRIMRLFKLPPETNYLFLGDYVDRGSHSVDVLMLLLCLFCEYPIEVTLLRGNHEFEAINRDYGFYREVLNYFGDISMFNMFQEVFSFLPIVAIVDGSVLCVHGGISPRGCFLKHYQNIPMPFTDYSQFPIVEDLLWSDPTNTNTEFDPNSRGKGFVYGKRAVKSFLESNNLKLIVRAHQCQINGFKSFCDELGVTIFSASNYNPRFSNKSGVLKIGKNGRLFFYSLGTENENSARASVILRLKKKSIGMECVNGEIDDSIQFLRGIKTIEE